MQPDERTEIGRSDAEPEFLGPCQLIAALGMGGMGTVWRGEMIEDRPWATAGSVVAVKVLHPHRILDANFERFT